MNNFEELKKIINHTLNEVSFEELKKYNNSTLILEWFEKNIDSQNINYNELSINHYIIDTVAKYPNKPWHLNYIFSNNTDCSNLSTNYYSNMLMLYEKYLSNVDDTCEVKLPSLMNYFGRKLTDFCEITLKYPKKKYDTNIIGYMSMSAPLKYILKNKNFKWNYCKVLIRTDIDIDFISQIIDRINPDTFTIYDKINLREVIDKNMAKIEIDDFYAD